MTYRLRSTAKVRRTSRMKLDWLHSLRQFATLQIKAGAFRDDRHKQRALYDLRDSLGLLLDLLEEPDTVSGPVDLRHEFLARRSAELERKFGK